MCKQCSSLLVPGLSSSIRFNAARDSHMTVTCLQCQRQTRRRTKHVKKPRKTSTQLEHVTVAAVTRVGEITVPVKHAAKAEPAQPKAPSKKQLKRQQAAQKREEDAAKNSTEHTDASLNDDSVMTRVIDISDETAPDECRDEKSSPMMQVTK